MIKTIGLTIALALLALPAAAAPQGGSMNASETLKVESREGKVLVTLSVDNAGAAPVYVPAAVYKDKELFGRTFTITTEQGVAIDYVGPMVKRGPFTAADFVKVAAGKKISNTIDITRSYDFKAGTHTYVLRCAGKVLPDLNNLDALATVALPAVTFNYTGK